MVLNPSQREAVTSQSHRLLLLAGPGTGKTETLTERIAYALQEHGVLPTQVLMFTYTNKAANNMIQRIRGKLHLQWGIRSGTFHSVCHRFLREEACTKGLLPAYQVLPEHHATRLRKETADAYLAQHPGANELLRKHKVNAAELLNLYERKLKLNLQPRFLETAAEPYRRIEAELTEIAQAASKLYSEMKQSYQVFDFNDLLYLFLNLLQNYEDVRTRIQHQFPQIYVDEYQDTNQVQVSILKQLVYPESFLTVVGDDTQSIYAFQGSEVANIRRFARDFPGADAIVLNENYRSSPPIVTYVNALNATCRGALTKTLISRGPSTTVKPRLAIFHRAEQEAEWVVREIQRLHREEQTPLGEIAILTRMGSIAASVETALQREGIPYTREGGIKFVDLKHIQFFISFLELLENPFDWLAWEVLLPAIPNIGEQLTQVIIQDLKANQGHWTWKEPPVFSLGRGKRFDSVMNFWREMVKASEVPKASKEGIQPFLEAVLPFFKNIYARYFFGSSRMIKVPSAKHLPDRIEDHIQDIQEYIIGLSTSYIGLVRDFISEVVANQDQKENRRNVTLSTIHSAKGLEWDAVFVIGNTENVFPSKGFGLELNDLEEERRLFYVACSRAKRLLSLSLSYHYPMPKVKGRPSEFVQDPKTKEFLQLVEEPKADPFKVVNHHRQSHYALLVPHA